MRQVGGILYLVSLAGLCVIGPLRTSVQAQDRVMGEIQFVSTTEEATSSGVWVDSQYVGYVGALKGSKRLRLPPGEHEISVRQAGYSDFNQKVVIESSRVVDVRVAMERDPRFIYPDPKTNSEVRLDVQPGTAAVFLDDYYVGTADRYYGVDHAMLVAPGKHRFKIALGGFKTFETEVTLSPRQKLKIRTDLAIGSANDADPSIRAASSGATSNPNLPNSPAGR
jgi:hypothetical protein